MNDNHDDHGRFASAEGAHSDSAKAHTASKYAFKAEQAMHTANINHSDDRHTQAEHAVHQNRSAAAAHTKAAESHLALARNLKGANDHFQTAMAHQASAQAHTDAAANYEHNIPKAKK